MMLEPLSDALLIFNNGTLGMKALFKMRRECYPAWHGHLRDRWWRNAGGRRVREVTPSSGNTEVLDDGLIVLKLRLEFNLNLVNGKQDQRFF